MTAPNTETTSKKTQIGDGAVDGQMLGISGGKVGFYGTAPVAQQTTATAVATTAPSAGSGVWGFTSSTQAEAVIAGINAIKVALDALGLTA